MRLIAGLDSGLDGGLVILGDIAQCFPMPVIENKIRRSPKPKRKPGETDSRYESRCWTVKREYDLPRLIDLLSPVSYVFLEKQQAMSQPVPHRCGRCGAIQGLTTPQGSVSIFSHGRGYGLLEGLVAGMRIPYELIHAKSWQSALISGLGGDTKTRARMVAGRLFPGLDLRASERSRNAHEGIVDALLLAEFGRRKLGGEIHDEEPFTVRDHERALAERAVAREEPYEATDDDLGF